MPLTKRQSISSLLMAFCVGLTTPGFPLLQSPQWGMASAQDILSALGPDGQGLPLSADKLPDLFELTASRLDEQPKKFVVEEQYVAGRWKGGKAVIEYARDLSYTLVSVYDKAGHRQRIYSVRARAKGPSDNTKFKKLVKSIDVDAIPEEAPPEEEVAPPAGKSAKARGGKNGRNTAAQEVAEVPPEEESRDADLLPDSMPSKSGGSKTSKTDKSKKSKNKKYESVVSEQHTEEAAAPEAQGAYVWDEKQGAYVPAQSAGSSAPSTLKTPPPLPPAAATPPPLEKPTTVASRKVSKRRRNAPADSTPAATQPRSPNKGSEGDVASAGGAGFVWDENQGAYVPAGKGSSAAGQATMPVEPTESAPASAKPEKGSGWWSRHMKSSPTKGSSASSSKGSKGNKESAESTESAPPPSSSGASSEKPTGAENVPSTEELLTQETPGATAPPPAQETKSSGHGKSSKRGRGKSSSSSESSGSNAASSASSSEAPAAEPSASSTLTPSELAAAAKRLRAAEQAENPQDNSAAAPPPSAADKWSNTATPAQPEAEPKAVSTMTPSERAAYEAARRPPPRTASRGPSSSGSKSSAPAYDASLDGNQAGHGKLDSDQWAPKAGQPAPAVDEAPTQVAMLPKPAPPPPDASIDNLLKMAAQNQNAVPDESSKWQPKTAPMKTQTADADVIAELNRIRAAHPENKPAPPKVKRDVNNPEEGVLPVNSFEKFSGPRYGRHREYERRFYYGKHAGSPVDGYDFYVDEVDRKKEIHNIYYYQKGKAPKLIAVERHSHVTFLSNYDVDKEGKGKVNKY